MACETRGQEEEIQKGKNEVLGTKEKDSVQSPRAFTNQCG